MGLWFSLSYQKGQEGRGAPLSQRSDYRTCHAVSAAAVGHWQLLWEAYSMSWAPGTGPKGRVLTLQLRQAIATAMCVALWQDTSRAAALQPHAAAFQGRHVLSASHCVYHWHQLGLGMGVGIPVMATQARDCHSGQDVPSHSASDASCVPQPPPGSAAQRAGWHLCAREQGQQQEAIKLVLVIWVY
jgi:hypothetical protein